MSLPVPFLDSTIGKDDLPEVLNALENSKFPSKWEHFATKLKIKQNIIEEINKNNKDCTDCFRVTLQHWLAKGKGYDYEVCNEICHHIQYTLSPYNKCRSP